MRSDRLAAEDTAWAYEEVQQRVADQRDDVMSLLETLARLAPSELALAYLGAGPVEDLIAWHGPAWIEAVDSLAMRDERFQLAVRCVWFGGDVDEAIVERLRRFGPPL